MAVSRRKRVPMKKEAGTQKAGGLLKPVEPEKAFFDGDAETIRVTRDIHPGQLLHEVDTALGDPDRYHVIGHLEQDDHPVSETNPFTLHIHGGVDAQVVRDLVDSHEKDPHFGLSPEQIEIEKLKTRLRSGEDLSAAELNKVVRGIL